MKNNSMPVENLYDQLFDIIFLVKYGYYDVSVKKDSDNFSDSNFELNFNYGSSDNFFYKVFNMEHVSQFIDTHPDISNLFNLKTINKNITTEPVYFNIPKNSSARRQYKMPNLYSYMLISYFITENKNNFTSIFLKNKHSTSKYFSLFNFNFNTTSQLKEQLLQGGNNLLHTDLSNFYHTLYTHSIPWVIDGKDNAKKERRSKKKGFADNLDKVLTLSQYDETHGIPTGSLASRIVAELYMCHIDLKLENKGFIYSRYVDDITYSFTHENQKNNFMKEYGLICREFNLNLNETKTNIEAFPFLNKMDKSNIFKFLDHISEYATLNTWIKEISSLIDLCVSEEAKGNKGSIKALFSIISNQIKKRKFNKIIVNNLFTTVNDITNFNIIKKLLDISLKDSKLTNKFISFIEKLNKKGVSSNHICKIISDYFFSNKDTITTNFEHYIHMDYNQEVYQILLYLVEFNISNWFSDEDLLMYLTKDLDDYSLCLLVILYLKQDGDIKSLLEVVDNKLQVNHAKYPPDHIRMAETLWLFRYFIYSLVENKILDKADINGYCSNKNYGSNTKGYKTELNWKYIKNNPKENKLDSFYDELLTNEVLLVHFGEDNNFIYL